jgi:hypothetical protein
LTRFGVVPLSDENAVGDANGSTNVDPLLLVACGDFLTSLFLDFGLLDASVATVVASVVEDDVARITTRNHQEISSLAFGQTLMARNRLRVDDPDRRASLRSSRVVEGLNGESPSVGRSSTTGDLLRSSGMPRSTRSRIELNGFVKTELTKNVVGVVDCSGVVVGRLSLNEECCGNAAKNEKSCEDLHLFFKERFLFLGERKEVRWKKTTLAVC